jgi:hypothetical protein
MASESSKPHNNRMFQGASAVLWLAVIMPQTFLSAAQDSWEGYRNRLVPEPPPITRQDFGYREGRIGGWVRRSTTPAWYAKVIEPVTLKQPLSASGTFAVKRSEGGSGVLFGWFNAESRGWRMPNSLVIRLDGNANTCWIFFEYGTRSWFTGGGATFEGRYQTTKTPPLRADGAVHPWRLEYRPQTGEVEFVLDGKSYFARVPESHREDGATFDRFGIVNQQNTGDGMEVYFDDLQINGERFSFDSDPKWEGKGNRTEFRDHVRRPFHDFGHTPEKQVGGIIWRDERPAFYGKSIPPLTLNDSFFASGTITFRSAGSDSGAYFGFFNAESKRNKLSFDLHAQPTNMVAIMVEGPSRIGHYFRAGYRNALGEGMFEGSGPTIKPDGQLHRWSMRYDPKSKDSDGEIVVIFDDKTQTTRVRKDHKSAGGRFDRFGIVNIQSGGHHVEFYLDELQFTGN